MTIADEHRVKVMKHISQMDSLRNSWPIFELTLRKLLGPNPTGTELFNLGEKMELIFRSNIVTGRSNKNVAIGGAAWEGLVLWYLNMIFTGTDVVVVKPTDKLTPPTIQDALAVTISNNRTNTEADLIAFAIPEPEQTFHSPETSPVKIDIPYIDKLIAADTLKCDVTVIQCKTNWNDNAQIPMLWDLIYGTKGFRIPGVSVGVNGAGTTIFRNFSYSFVTVPTSKDAFKPTSMCVLRVHGLTGGNYWGRKSTTGVSAALSEFFQRNFGDHFHGSVQNSVDRAIASDSGLIERYLKLDF